MTAKEEPSERFDSGSRNAADHGYGPNNVSPRAFWLDFKAGVVRVWRLLRGCCS